MTELSLASALAGRSHFECSPCGKGSEERPPGGVCPACGGPVKDNLLTLDHPLRAAPRGPDGTSTSGMWKGM